MRVHFFLIIIFVGSVLNVRRTKATVIRNTNNCKNALKEICALVALLMRLGSQHPSTLLSNCPFSWNDLKKK